MLGNNVAIKGLQATLHILIWFTFLALPLSMRQDWTFSAVAPTMTFNVMLIGFFYVNAFVLIPKILDKKGAWQYALSIVVCMALMLACLWWLEAWFHEELTAAQSERARRRASRPFRTEMRFIFSVFNCVFVFGLSTSYHFITRWNRQQHEAKEQEKERLASELAFLKSQISPHFMFNVLNSMVAMARKKSDLLEPTIIKLSQLMRYMLYDADLGRVPLEKEVAYLESYIELQRMRMGSDVQIDFEVSGDIAHCTIEPMLFIPFVENAFKHGVGLVERPTIQFSLAASQDWIVFEAHNKKSPALPHTKDDSSGIGLVNVKRRLELLYKEKHVLHIDETETDFKVHLELPT